VKLKIFFIVICCENWRIYYWWLSNCSFYYWNEEWQTVIAKVNGKYWMY